jgi:predicted small secreted protein
MIRLRDTRLKAVLVVAGATALLAGCNTIGGTMRGAGQDISQTGQFLTGKPRKEQAQQQPGQMSPSAPVGPQAATPPAGTVTPGPGTSNFTSGPGASNY